MGKALALVFVTAVCSAQPPKADWNKFWPQFQSAVARKDAKAVAGMMQFPLDWELGKVRKIQSAADFVANFDRYFPADLIAAVATKKPILDPGGEYTVSWKAHGDECTLFFKDNHQGAFVLEALSEGPPMAP
jgi:hypothetical protein